MSLCSRLMEDGGACQPRGWGIAIWTTWLTDGFLLAWAFCLILWDKWGVGDIFTTLGYPQTCSDVVSVKCVPLLPRSYEHYTQSIKGRVPVRPWELSSGHGSVQMLQERVDKQGSSDH